jgi:NAD(P)-dependent dehydrogenase (short-subunit alcohol dehydrogenase family)
MDVDWRSVVDDALEVSVVGSFSALGIRARRRLHAWQEPQPDALHGRTVVITGPTSGIGLAATKRFADLGARVVLVARDRSKLDALRTSLTERHAEDRFPAAVADMGELASVRKAAFEIAATEHRIDVVVDNAGAMFPERGESPDGIERTLAVMVVGPFAFVSGLLPVLWGTSGARVISVSSGGQYAQAVNLDDLEWRTEPFDGTRAYARAKRVQVAVMREWARRTRGAVAFVAMHPGWADTPGLAASLPGFANLMGPILRSPDEGVDTLVWLATAADPSNVSGGFFHDRRSRPFDRVPWTRLRTEDRRRLWDLVVGLAGGRDPAEEQ